ncbi:heat-shock protein Hsp90 [Flavobacterium jejuense]|uniref:Heat-shock protein Hsp90 n=1 Tax=Flavobacterium jejuense TaxID=1544455 RepID=A0ABX0IS48_9FLAO|nr:heat-shock protein Hsp90 [Flavobacterium jejuense]NHN26391.1 heat-shock protein Hsp90 [Flavobacterium jejuense]
MKKIAFISLLSLFISCKEEAKKEEIKTEKTQVLETEVKDIPEFTKGIEVTHKKEAFLANEIISYNLVVKFGGQDYLDAKFTQTVNGTLIKMERANGETVVYDGKEVYTNKTDANLPKDRFDIFTWPYFATIPYKLNDEGTVWSDFQNKTFYGENLATGKLSFEANIGDAPDDWYVIYKDPKNYLVGAAYIVSFGKGKKAAEKEPHAVKYTNFSEVNEIPFAKNWTYHMWTTEKGFGDQIGEATLTNITFSKQNDSLFKKFEKATLVTLK